MTSTVALVLTLFLGFSGNGCLRQGAKPAQGTAEPDTETEQEVLRWLGRGVPIRYADVYPMIVGMERASEFSHEKWIGEGRRIEGAGPILTRFLERGDPRVDPADVVHALIWLGNSESVPALIQALRSEDYWTRVGAAQALGNIADKKAVEPLCKTLLKDENSSVRANAAASLGKIRDAKARGALVSALKDEGSFVRKLAAEALGRLGDRAAVAALCESAVNDDRADVRAEAVASLGELGDPRARMYLESAAKDESPSVREAAEEALKKLEPTD